MTIFCEWLDLGYPAYYTIVSLGLKVAGIEEVHCNSYLVTMHINIVVRFDIFSCFCRCVVTVVHWTWMDNI